MLRLGYIQIVSLSLKENSDKSFPPLSDNDKKIEGKRNKHCRTEQHEGLISAFRHFEFCGISLTFIRGLNAALKKNQTKPESPCHAVFVFFELCDQQENHTYHVSYYYQQKHNSPVLRA